MVHAQLESKALATSIALTMVPALMQAQPDGKVLAVATAVRQALEQAGQERFLRPLLTSFAVCNDLEGALAFLKVVQELQMAREEGARLLLRRTPRQSLILLNC